MKLIYRILIHLSLALPLETPGLYRPRYAEVDI